MRCPILTRPLLLRNAHIFATLFIASGLCAQPALMIRIAHFPGHLATAISYTLEDNLRDQLCRC